MDVRLLVTVLCGAVSWYPDPALSASDLQSVCQSTAYRSLPANLQNEHQCMVLERLQSSLQSDRTSRDRYMSDFQIKLNRLESKIERGFSRLANGNFNKNKKARGFPSLMDIPPARDCNELMMAGINISGVYPIRLPTDYVINVWCDMDTEKGGWTTIQRRQDGSVNFTREWDAYAGGFGNINKEFWLGNENIYQLTNAMHYTLRVDLWDWEGNGVQATYDLFKIASEEDGYRLYVDGYNGTAGDSLSYHSSMKFSTPDRDNDIWHSNCAHKDRSGWWFKSCSSSSLNGIYHQDGLQEMPPDGVFTGITWYRWKKNPAYSMKRCEMKIKPRTAVMAEKELTALSTFEDV